MELSSSRKEDYIEEVDSQDYPYFHKHTPPLPNLYLVQAGQQGSCPHKNCNISIYFSLASLGESHSVPSV